MTRFASIPLALALIVLGVGQTHAQETPADKPKTAQIIPIGPRPRTQFDVKPFEIPEITSGSDETDPDKLSERANFLRDSLGLTGVAGINGDSNVEREGLSSSLANYQTAYKKRDKEARQTAEAYRRVSHLGPQHPTSQKLKMALHQAVAAAFEARQELQRTELAKLQQRLKRIQQLIETREQIIDEIIDHRVEELLNPALRWAAPTKTGTYWLSPNTTPAAGALPGPSPAARAVRDTLRERWKLVDEAYKSGEVGLVDVITAAKQYYEAEAAAAENVEERRNARQHQVEQLKQLKAVTERMYEAALARKTDVLAVEVELLKAEARLKREQAYTCSMHPQVRQIGPDNCPICGMALRTY